MTLMMNSVTTINACANHLHMKIACSNPVHEIIACSNPAHVIIAKNNMNMNEESLFSP